MDECQNVIDLDFEELEKLCSSELVLANQQQLQQQEQQTQQLQLHQQIESSKSSADDTIDNNMVNVDEWCLLMHLVCRQSPFRVYIMLLYGDLWGIAPIVV